MAKKQSTSAAPVVSRWRIVIEPFHKVSRGTTFDDDLLTGPLRLYGVYRTQVEGKDTCPVGATVRFFTNEDTERVLVPTTWWQAAHFDPANAGGRFSYDFELPANAKLAGAWAGVILGTLVDGFFLVARPEYSRES